MPSSLQQLISSCRKVTICLDGWTAKGLVHSYLGVSACFYDPTSGTVKHAILNLFLLPHPHTGAAIADALQKSLTEWNIEPNKILLVVTDNGAIVVKAMKLLHEKEIERIKTSVEDLQNSSDSDSATVTSEYSDNELEQYLSSVEYDSDDALTEDIATVADETDDDTVGSRALLVDDRLELPETIPYRRMPCMAHTLQLIIKPIYTKHYKGLVAKVRHMVGQARKSSVVSERLVERCGKNVVSDCQTRWNSTFFMAQRLLDIKQHVNEVLSEAGIDTLLASEWVKLQEMTNLLEPFANHTDILQTDSLSMSYIIPCLLDLECHLQGSSASKAVTSAILTDLKARFSSILNPLSHLFNPIPATACLLDHTVAGVLMSTEMEHLLAAAKSYITSQVSNTRLLFTLCNHSKIAN